MIILRPHFISGYHEKHFVVKIIGGRNNNELSNTFANYIRYTKYIYTGLVYVVKSNIFQKK